MEVGMRSTVAAMAGTVAVGVVVGINPTVAVGVGLSEFAQAAARINTAIGTINEITRSMQLPSVKYTFLARRSVHAFF